MHAAIVAISLLSGLPFIALFFHKKTKLAKIIGATGILLGCIVGLFGLWQYFQDGISDILTLPWHRNITFSLAIDHISALFLIPIYSISFIATIYSFSYLSDETKGLRIAVNQFLLGILISAMVVITLAKDMVAFLLAWEFMSISSCFLVVFDYEKKQTRHAAYIYFVFTQAGAMFIFAAFGLLYSLTGSFDLASASIISPNMKLLVFFLSFLGFASKAGVFPFHIWLPHAHPAAPSHVSALMSGVMIKMGIYGMLRLYFELGSDTLIFGRTLLIFGIISGVIGVLYALGQDNLKRLLAYSSIENVGIILLGIGFGMMGISYAKPVMAICGFTGAFMHLINHSIFKSLLFMGAGSVGHATGALDMAMLGGLMKRMKATGIAFMIGSIAICGLPPFNGFVGEFLIYNSAFHVNAISKVDLMLTMLAVIALAVIGGLAVACFTKALSITFLGEPRANCVEKAHESPFLMRLALWILVALCVAIGIAPFVFIKPVALSASFLITHFHKDVDSYAGLHQLVLMLRHITLGVVVFLGLTGIILLVRKLVYKDKEVSACETWGCGFTRATSRIQYTSSSFAASMMAFFKPLAPMREELKEPDGVLPTNAGYQATMQDIAEFFAVKRIALPLVKGMRALRWIQHGNIQVYISYIVLAVIAMIIASWVWR